MTEQPSDYVSAKELFAPSEPIEGTRDRITATALELFYEQGFHAVGLDIIIKNVGVTKTTFYNHFDSKDDLIVAAIEMRDRWENKAYMDDVEAMSDGTARGDILAFFDVLDKWFSYPEYKGCLFINACAEFPHLHDPVHKAASSHVGDSREALIQLCEQIEASDPESLATQLQLLMQGALTMRLVSGDDSTAREARKAAERLLDDAA
ncbi:MAG: TetR/AcrR family transcriptional regulator, partial [Planctomycetota bacterium]